MKQIQSNVNWLGRLKEVFIYSDTHLLEVCLSLTLLAKATYGTAFRGYPSLMLITGSLISFYGLASTFYSQLDHRHRSISLMSVYYATHIYASTMKIGLPPTRVVYLIMTLLLPPLYLKWRLYREIIHREH